MLQRLRRRVEREAKKLLTVARIYASGLIESEREVRQERGAVDEALAVWGLCAEYAEAAAPEPLYLWPCNLDTWNFFMRCQTQWLRDDGVATGLDYPGLESVMRLRGIKKSRRAELFDDLQQMEFETLNAWRERREKDG